MIKNEKIPKFKSTVKDKNKKHPTVTISRCNTDGFSVLCPGTSKKQRKTNSIIKINPNPGTGLSYDTYFFLRLRFPIKTEIMNDTRIINRIGRVSVSQIKELERKM